MKANDPVAALRSVLSTRRYLVLRKIADSGSHGRTLEELRKLFPNDPPTGIYRDALQLEADGLTRPTGGKARRPGVDASWTLAVDVHAWLQTLTNDFPTVDI